MNADPSISSTRTRHPVVSRAARALLALALVGCGSSDGGAVAGPAPVVPPPDLLGNPEAGEVAFVQSCASCHASRDGFDLAAFEFNEFDVIRRGIAHVDSATSRDIAAHIKRLNAESMRRHVAPFQPAGKILGDRPYFSTVETDDDLDFWEGVFGTTAWPAWMTADRLRAIDPREYAVPLAMPRWSLEGSREDWMPDGPLTPEVLDIDGGRVRTALGDYYTAPSEAALLEVLARFREVTVGAGRMCWREDPVPCFDARRWMSSLGAQHYLRIGADAPVPAEVARLWWDVGESEIAMQSISRSGDERDTAFRSGARWMYLAFSYAPDAFREPAGYMGTFLSSQGLRRVSLFAALRRMVGDGIAHAEHPDQFLEDARLSVRRADFEVGVDVVEFVFGHLVDRLGSGLPEDLDPVGAQRVLAETWDSARRFSSNSPQWYRIQELHAQVLEVLQ